MTTALGPSWMEPEHLISTAGFIGLLLVIFAEGGLLFGMVFPGESLLFTAGLLLSDGKYLDQPLWLACLCLWVAACLGNQVGYLIGRKAGPAVFSRPNSRLFKQSYVDRTTEFFEQYGGRAILMARFVPVVRTLITFMAGACRMDLRVYTTYSIIGGGIWAAGTTALGYRLGEVDFVRDHIEVIMIGIVIMSFVPVAMHLRKERRKVRGLTPAAEAEIKKAL
jgi:membrane-associated protein